jgi:outer membrane protein OmpA-like peptidoglycan-associated protein
MMGVGAWRVVGGVVVCCLSLGLAAPALAQEPGDPDAEGCKDSGLLTRMAGCTIVECSAREFDAVSLQVKPRSEGDEGMQEMEGAIESVQYVCPARLSFLQLQRNALNAFKAAGYAIVLNGKDGNDNPIVTARKGAQWVQVETGAWNDDSSYTLTAVKVEAMKQELAADAAAMAAEINRAGSVAVYGVTFDTAKATLQPGSEQVLGEIATLLKQHTDWRFEVQGHTDNVGQAAANLALSEQRAKAVVAWLAANGIDAERLVAKGYGDTRPVAENGTEDGRAKNRRVELKKLNEE